MIVCICRRISDRQIREAASQGAHSLECLQIEFGLATACGRCADCATGVLQDVHRSRSAASTACPGAGHCAVDCAMPHPALA
jgi:bacterioferritin-associated ferredoxin